ncbi:MAG TPA: hypothetical protein DHV12_07625 [Thermotogae bacterium]|nr:hypothetical protein [Thermotogota bacterium]
MRVLFLGVDIGTSSTKAVVVNEKGKILAEGLSDTYIVEMPKPAWAQQNAEVWVKGFKEAVTRALGKLNTPSKNITAMCISGLYGGTGVPVDENFEPLYPALIWMDKRAVEETLWVKEHLGWEKIFELTGNYTDPYFGYTKLLWLKKHEPDVWKKTHLFLTPKDYVIYLLTGEVVIDLSSAGNIGGIFDVRKKKWSEEAAELLGIELSKFPEHVVDSSEIVGRLNSIWANKLSLKEGLPIVAGGIDAAVATLAAGVTKPGEHAAMVGTSMCWGSIHTGYRIDWRLVNFPYVTNGRKVTYSFGGATTSGAIIEWFKKLTGVGDLSEITQHAEKISVGSDGLILLPFFMGERAPIWKPEARATLHGLSLSHGPAHLFRAVLEAIAFSLRSSMDVAGNIGIKLEPELRVVGGLTRNPLWLKITAAVVNRKLLILPTSLDAPYGDAFLAALAVGEVGEPDSIKNWIEWKTVEPDSKLISEYERVYQNYVELMRKLGALRA